MNLLEIFIFVSFATLLYSLKFFYDKYTSIKSLFDILVLELEQSISENDSLNEQKNIIDLKLSQTEKNNQSEVFALKTEITALKANYQEQKALHQIEIKEAVSAARKDAINKSRSVLRGQASEHLAPYVIKGTNPKDYRFMGNPIDYVCFEGLSDILDGKSDYISSIKFIDIKTGKSSLNKSQRRIRDAIKENKVTFEVINIDEKILNDRNISSSEN